MSTPRWAYLRLFAGVIVAIVALALVPVIIVGVVIASIEVCR